MSRYILIFQCATLTVGRYEGKGEQQGNWNVDCPADSGRPYAADSDGCTRGTEDRQAIIGRFGGKSPEGFREERLAAEGEVTKRGMKTSPCTWIEIR